ncbi:MAG: DUF2242 domain-containing protein [Burkholderiaceae bacterium]|nr:DUF2242 domain-containing protein [Burkholderiaceae bacterium]
MAALLAGCAPTVPVPLADYHPESFNANNAYVHRYATSPARTCEAARRALLSQGYVMDVVKADQVAGRKSFQPDNNHHVELEFRVVCTVEGEDADDGTTVFANGLEDQYSLRKTKESASLGVSPLGSLSLPLASGIDQMVKVASETVTDPALYQRLFDLIDQFLASGEIPENPIPPAATPASEAASALTPAQSPTAAQPAASAPEQSPSAVQPAASAPEQNASIAQPAASAPAPSASPVQPAASAPEQSPSAVQPAASAPEQSASAAPPAVSTPEQGPSMPQPAAIAFAT